MHKSPCCNPPAFFLRYLLQLSIKKRRGLLPSQLTCMQIHTKHRVAMASGFVLSSTNGNPILERKFEQAFQKWNYYQAWHELSVGPFIRCMGRPYMKRRSHKANQNKPWVSNFHSIHGNCSLSAVQRDGVEPRLLNTQSSCLTNAETHGSCGKPQGMDVTLTVMAHFLSYLLR